MVERNSVTVGTIAVTCAFAGWVTLFDVPSVGITTAIVVAVGIALVHTTLLARVESDSVRVVWQSLPVWIAVAAVVSPIPFGSGIPVVPLVQTIGQGVAVGTIITVGGVGLVRVVASLTSTNLTAPSERPAIVPSPSRTGSATVVTASAVAVVGLVAVGPVVPATIAGLASIGAVRYDGETRTAFEACAFVAATVTVDGMSFLELTPFLIAAIVTVVATDLLPSRLLHHVSFAVGMGAVSGLFVASRSAPVGVRLSPFGLALFAGLTLSVSTVAAGLFAVPVRTALSAHADDPR